MIQKLCASATVGCKKFFFSHLQPSATVGLFVHSFIVRLQYLPILKAQEVKLDGPARNDTGKIAYRYAFL